MKPEFCLCKAITEPTENVFYLTLNFEMWAAEKTEWSLFLNIESEVLTPSKPLSWIKKMRKTSLLPPSPKYFGVFSMDNQCICQRYIKVL